MSSDEAYKIKEYREKAYVIEKKLINQEKFITKIKNYIKYKNLVRMKLKHVGETCRDPKNTSRILLDPFTRELIMMYACTRLSQVGIHLHFDIDGYINWLQILEKPDKKYSKEFIQDMSQLAPSYIWSWKIQQNLENQEPEALKIRLNLAVELKNLYEHIISVDDNYRLFMQTLRLRDNLIKKLALILVKRLTKEEKK